MSIKSKDYKQSTELIIVKFGLYQTDSESHFHKTCQCHVTKVSLDFSFTVHSVNTKNKHTLNL